MSILKLDILIVLEPYSEDRAISSYEFHINKPLKPEKLCKGEEIRIQILNSDFFVQQGEAFLYVEGELSAIDKYFPLFLFQEIRL